MISDCQLQSRSRGPDFKSPSRESHLTIYRALNQGKQSPKMLAQVDKASETSSRIYEDEHVSSISEPWFYGAEDNPALVLVELLQKVVQIKSKFRLE